MVQSMPVPMMENSEVVHKQRAKQVRQYQGYAGVICTHMDIAIGMYIHDGIACAIHYVM